MTTRVELSARKVLSLTLGLAVSLVLVGGTAFARDIEYGSGEVSVNVTPGEPTQIKFPGTILGGFKKQVSALALDRKDSDLIVFASEGLSQQGEAIIVRLKDGRSYSIRIKKSNETSPRDAVVKIEDDRSTYVDEDELKPHEEKKFDYAPASTVSGLMREMVLVAEFGKKNIPGYRVSDRHQGDTVLADGAIHTTIDKIFIGPNLWGYVLDAKNNLGQTVKLNPATFRLDGTRAISAKTWELAPTPYNVEQQISSRDKTKVYVITKAKRYK